MKVSPYRSSVSRHERRKVPLIAGATVETLINAAGGLTDSAFLRLLSCRLTELSDGQVTAVYRDVNVANGRDGSTIELKSRDHVTVRDIPDWSPTDSILVEGEVKFPGEYRIRVGETCPVDQPRWWLYHHASPSQSLPAKLLRR